MRTVYIELQVQTEEDEADSKVVQVIKEFLEKNLLLKSVKQLPMEDSVE